jgi:DNA-binding NtrC family response regulator
MEPQDVQPHESLMDPQQTTLQVVMVDDEEALCLGVRRIIEKYKVHVADVLVDADYRFRYFTSGEDYLTYLSEGGEVDLLLLDLKLPGVGGMDVLDAMSAQGRVVLTIMITAYATFETAVKATKLGAYDFHPQQAGAQAGRGEAPGALQLHLRPGARAQGPPQRR